MDYQKIYKFENGYGASVVKNDISYGSKEGLFELGVIKFDNNNWKLCYDTPITDDVIGYLKQEEIEPILEQIKNLPEIENHG